MTSAYFLSHNGLGDNISNIGAVKYLLGEYYDTIYFICKDTNLVNVTDLYTDQRVHFVPIDSHNEMGEYSRILTPIYSMENIDVLVSGFCLKPYYKSKITNQKLLSRQKIQCYRIQPRFDFIRTIYEDIYLDLSIYYNYFCIGSTETSRAIYDNIRQYNVIFVHTQSSDQSLDFIDILKKFMDDKDNLIICADHNVYGPHNEQYVLAEKYVNLPVSNYIDIILNAWKIYVVDSCFSTIIIPLMNVGKLRTNDCNIFDRKDHQVIGWSFKIDQHTQHALIDLLGKAINLSF